MRREDFTPGELGDPSDPMYGHDASAVIDDDVKQEHGGCAVITCRWKEVPHLSPKQIEQMLADAPSHEREARSTGMPVLTSGMVYPVDQATYVIDDRDIPNEWPRAYGMDVGKRVTAAVFGAIAPDGTLYIYDEYYSGPQLPSIHALFIKEKAGEWMEGAIDPASIAESATDLKSLFNIYTEEGLLVCMANNSVQAGIDTIWRMMRTGKLKILKRCENLIKELKFYQRDDKGNIKKERDHACDAMRYLGMLDHSFFSTVHEYEDRLVQEAEEAPGFANRIGSSRITGY